MPFLAWSCNARTADRLIEAEVDEHRNRLFNFNDALTLESCFRASIRALACRSSNGIRVDPLGSLARPCKRV